MGGNLGRTGGSPAASFVLVVHARVLRPAGVRSRPPSPANRSEAAPPLLYLTIASWVALAVVGVLVLLVLFEPPLRYR
ncbi:MAG: hypothetical protein JWO31_2056, partial [Phycisphaerales bacterium]|nr:hypothetical protein [Phycisphaerales bacterium]